HVHLPDEADIDAHCERARAAGAEILRAPADQFYGERVYRARDPGRHVWTFGKHVRDVTNDEMSAATGLKIDDFR
ncbi:VOC family protein, partial [Burkholderia sp.]|uniref:VOC family protein n=1 Tax=Burkholderia sp. TaxID=36773 RepID=UPI00258EA06E